MQMPIPSFDFNSIPFGWLMGAWLFSAAIQALPDPKEGGRFYEWMFKFLHIVGANMGKVMQKPMKKGEEDGEGKGEGGK